MSQMRWVCAAVWCAGALAGCTETGEGVRSDAAGGLEVSPDTYFADVPVRVGFHLVDSFVVEGKTRRVGELRYRGRGEVVELVEYYRNAMVASGWELINVMGTTELKNLLFRKEAEYCQIQVSGAGWRGGVNVRILVGENERTP